MSSNDDSIETALPEEASPSVTLRRPACQRPWRLLCNAERDGLGLLGWDARAWDSGDVRVGLFGSTTWDMLSREQKVIAGLLGFAQESWGASAKMDTSPRGPRVWPVWTAAATLESLCHPQQSAVPEADKKPSGKRPLHEAAQGESSDDQAAPLPKAQAQAPMVMWPPPGTYLSAQPSAAGVSGPFLGSVPVQLAPNCPPELAPPPGSTDQMHMATHAAVAHAAAAAYMSGRHPIMPQHHTLLPPGYDGRPFCGGVIPAHSAALGHPTLLPAHYSSGMPSLQTSLTSSLGPFLPKMLPLSGDMPGDDGKAEPPPSTICHGSLLSLGGDSVTGHHKVVAAGQRVCPSCQGSRLVVPPERARLLLHADECQWSKAREFYVAWSISPELTVSARRWRLAAPADESADLVVFSSAQSAAKADAVLGAAGGGQRLVPVDGEAAFSMCSRVKTLCPARNFGRGMGRGCIMHYQKRRVPLSEPGSAGLMLLEAGAQHHRTCVTCPPAAPG